MPRLENARRRQERQDDDPPLGARMIDGPGAQASLPQGAPRREKRLTMPAAWSIVDERVVQHERTTFSERAQRLRNRLSLTVERVIMCVSCCAAARFPAEDTAHRCLCGAPETLVAMRRIEAHLTRREMLGGTAAVIGMFAGFGLAPRYAFGQSDGGRPTRLANVRLFDGRTLVMRDDVDVLVSNGRISGLPGRGDPVEDAEVIDGGGRAVIPGLIDCHWHTTLTDVSMVTALTADIAYIHLVAAREAGATLRRGFTTVRDVGGPVFALKRAIDEGVVEGPHVFPSGAMISQTGGHGDFRFLTELPRTPSRLSYAEEVGVAMIADGRDAVLMRVREQLMKGASQIKMMAGGGVSSLYDPLKSTQYTQEELAAGVQAARDWGTYVCTHVYHSEGMQQAIRAGVACIEHGQLADEETVRMMAGEGTWWSLQPFLADEDANVKTEPLQRAQQQEVAEGTVRAYGMMRDHDVRSAFGTDILMSPGMSVTQGRQLAKLSRFMPPLEALRHATGDAGDLLALSGERAPYDGPFGVIAEGAPADLLVVDGDPETDLSFLGDPEANLRLIMKDGDVVKNSM